MDYHPKIKKNKKNNRANQKSNHGHVVGRDQDSLLYTKQKQIKPHYPTLQYRGVYKKKKKKPNTEQKRNKIQSKKETPNPKQTKPTVAPPLLASAARSVTSAPRLVVVPRSLVVVARRWPIVACPSSQIRTVSPSQLFRCSANRPQGISPPFSL